MKNIVLLALNDLAFSFKNKTFLLILFIPLFVFVTLNFVDVTGEQTSKVRIGLLEQETLVPEIRRNIDAASSLIEVTLVESSEEAVRLLQLRELDGVITVSEESSDGLALLVLKRDSVQTLAIVQIFAALQKSAQGAAPDWIASIESLQQGDIQRETLPTWILMLILLIGFIILPAQIAEEKEKKLLLGLLQTPINEVQWLLGKLILGMSLILTAVLFLHLLGQFGAEHLLSYIALLLAGSFCFSAFGIFLGFLCRTQASARTLGLIFYLPLLLPSAMSDVSAKFTAIAPLLPSYQLYKPLQAILLESASLTSISFDLVYLALLGSMMFLFSYLLMKRRWLM